MSDTKRYIEDIKNLTAENKAIETKYTELLDKHSKALAEIETIKRQAFDLIEEKRQLKADKAELEEKVLVLERAIEMSVETEARRFKNILAKYKEK